MFFPGYYQLIGQVDKTLLEQVNSNIEIFEQKNAYNFKHGEWLRLDSYYNPENYKLNQQVLIDWMKGLPCFHRP
jgi:hypothetical protein